MSSTHIAKSLAQWDAIINEIHTTEESPYVDTNSNVLHALQSSDVANTIVYNTSDEMIVPSSATCVTTDISNNNSKDVNDVDLIPKK